MPIAKISQQDDAGMVEAVLDSKQTKTMSISEEQFEKVARLLGNKTSEFGAWWVAYEEDWVEGRENLEGFADVISKSICTDLSVEIRELLISLRNLAQIAHQEDVPLIIQS